MILIPNDDYGSGKYEYAKIATESYTLVVVVENQPTEQQWCLMPGQQTIIRNNIKKPEWQNDNRLTHEEYSTFSLQAGTSDSV